ncbi:hypothetical protein ES703_123354 [subsurface metagenome]
MSNTTRIAHRLSAVASAKAEESSIQHQLSNSLINQSSNSLIHQLTNSPINQQFVVLSCKSCRNHARKNNLFMQNEPKLQNAKMNVSDYITRKYENLRLYNRRKNKAKQTQNKAKLKNDEMNVNALLRKGSENLRTFCLCQNKPKTNPIQTCVQPVRYEIISRVKSVSKNISVKSALKNKPPRRLSGDKSVSKNNFVNPVIRSEKNQCQSAKSAIKQSVSKNNFVNPVILCKESQGRSEKIQFKILVNRLKIWYNSLRT